MCCPAGLGGIGSPARSRERLEVGNDVARVGRRPRPDPSCAGRGTPAARMTARMPMISDDEELDQGETLSLLRKCARGAPQHESHSLRTPGLSPGAVAQPPPLIGTRSGFNPHKSPCTSMSSASKTRDERLKSAGTDAEHAGVVVAHVRAPGPPAAMPAAIFTDLPGVGERARNRPVGRTLRAVSRAGMGVPLGVAEPRRPRRCRSARDPGR